MLKIEVAIIVASRVGVKDCRVKKGKPRWKNAQAQRQREAANVAQAKEFGFAVLKTKGGPASWIIDSGATRHLCNDLRYLSQLRDINPMRIYAASGNSR
jgi:hypothetical protein